MFICIIILAFGAIWLVFLPRISFIFTLCVYFICIDSAFFLCRINYRRHSREYDDQCMKEKFATFVPFITFIPIANVVVCTTNAVYTCSTSPSSLPGCHERFSSSSTDNVRSCYLPCLGISSWNSGWLFDLLLYHTFSTLPWPSRRGCDLKSRLLFLYSHLLGSGLSKLWTL